jgi:hypothetical protein
MGNRLQIQFMHAELRIGDEAQFGQAAIVINVSMSQKNMR